MQEAQMNQEPIEDVLAGLVQEVTETREDINQSASLYEDYNLDSIDFMELFIRIEQVYGIRIMLQEYLSEGEELPLSDSASEMQEASNKEAPENVTAHNAANHSQENSEKMSLQDLNIEFLSNIISRQINH